MKEIKYIVHNGWRWNPAQKKAEYLTAREVRKEYGVNASECLHVDDRAMPEWWFHYFPLAIHLRPKDRFSSGSEVDWYGLRYTAKLTARELAEASSLTYNQYKNIELGRTTPPPYIRQRILLALKLRIKDNLNRSRGGRFEGKEK